MIADTPNLSGGVRGIIELEVLRAIESKLGNSLPIQAFFDLIVGTRYVLNLSIAIESSASSDQSNWLADVFVATKYGRYRCTSNGRKTVVYR